MRTRNADRAEGICILPPHLHLVLFTGASCHLSGFHLLAQATAAAASQSLPLSSLLDARIIGDWPQSQIPPQSLVLVSALPQRARTAANQTSAGLPSNQIGSTRTKSVRVVRTETSNVGVKSVP